MKKTNPQMGYSQNMSSEDADFVKKYWDNLSATTKRSKWINNPNEHEDHSGQSLATRSHDVITNWAKERGAVPATVPGSRYDNRPGVLRFDFPGYGGKKLEPIGWNEWFRTFDERKLVFVFQEHMKKGNMSNFFKMDSPYREKE